MGNRGPAAKAKAPTLSYPRGTPPPPAWLDALAVEEYLRAAKLMGDVMTVADMSILAIFAQAYSDFIRFTTDLRTESEVIRLNNGIVASNPKCVLRDQACKRMQAASSKLGFSPVDRAKVPAAATQVSSDGFEAFIT